MDQDAPNCMLSEEVLGVLLERSRKWEKVCQQASLALGFTTQDSDAVVQLVSVSARFTRQGSDDWEATSVQSGENSGQSDSGSNLS